MYYIDEHNNDDTFLQSLVELNVEEIKEIIYTKPLDTPFIRLKGTFDIHNPLRWTPLEFILTTNNTNIEQQSNIVSIIKIILDAGANVNRADDHGLTPIFLAGLTFCKSIVAVLLHYGADPHIFIDMPYCCPVAFDPIASRDIIDLLEDYGYTITVIQRCYVSGKIPWCALKHIRNE